MQYSFESGARNIHAIFICLHVPGDPVPRQKHAAGKKPQRIALFIDRIHAPVFRADVQ